MNNRILLGISHGDMNGIGYEIILKTLADPEILESFTPVIYGSPKAFIFHKKMLDLPSVNFNQITDVRTAASRKINIINCNSDDVKVEIGQQTAEAGKAAFEALERAVADLKSGLIDALVTAPVNKKNIQSEQFHFPGHTEYLQQKAGNHQALMLLANDMMRVAVATGHVPLAEVPKQITENLIFNKIQALNVALKQDFMIVRPRIAILALNPHAGDDGVIGTEEQTAINPAIKRAVEAGIACVGAYPADGFFGAGKFRNFDGILAMYHDQGLIPFKALSMDSGVNITAGLPFVRTSPDHGTAYDIAGKNIASEESFRHACFAAVDILKNRRAHDEMYQNPLKVEIRAEQNGRIE